MTSTDNIFTMESGNQIQGETSREITVHVKHLPDSKEKGRAHCNQHQNRHSICIVPSILWDMNQSFRPRVVSIGPLHRDDASLKEFEVEKHTCLRYMLDRLGSPAKQVFEACFLKLNASILKIGTCYAGMKTYQDHELIILMIIDAFFILELLIQPSRFLKNSIQGNIILERSIFIDLMLLENQIPFFVLQDIFDTLNNSMPNSPHFDSPLISHILFLFENFSFFLRPRNNVVGIAPDHILGLLQNSFHPKSTTMLPSDHSFNSALERNSFLNKKHPVLVLDSVGVKFKPYKDENWQMAIQFQSSSWFGCRSWWGSSKATLRMPKLYIFDDTEQILKNIIAYEKCTPGVPKYVSSYLWAMDTLINNPGDLGKLIESKVIVNMLRPSTKAVLMINNICKNIELDQFYYKEQWQHLDQYYNDYGHGDICKYFSNPWTIIVLLVAFILFGLVITRIIFTIKGADAK